MNPPCPFTYISPTPQLTAAIHKLTPLIMLNCQIMGSYPPDKSSFVYRQPYPVYDFIIVGAGSAGSAIAGRLSEIAAWNVLLIEAGTNPPINADIPFLYSTLTESPYDWNYTTEATGDSCLGFVGNRCNWPRGKVLGGSSSINGMLAVRGNPKDFDNWESMGNPGWGYKHVLKYFKKLERLRVAKFTDKAAHGYDGNVFRELYTNKTVYNNKQTKNYIGDYSIEAGYKLVEDIDAHHQTGLTLLTGTLHDDVRWNTAKAYLQPARYRRNLTVMKETMVTEILIDEQKRAYGVRVCKNGKCKNIHCRKEVIVSAGAINSPQLLMLSGIGPEEHLNKFQIPVKQNLCVGCNLRDHLIIRYYVIYAKFSSYKVNRDLLYLLRNYLESRTDVGTSPDAMLFFNTSRHTADFPNIQLNHDITPQSKQFSDIFQMTNPKPEIEKAMQKNIEKAPLIRMSPSLLRPESQGRILLNSKDPFEHPRIISGYATERKDVDELIEALRIVEKISQSKAFKKYGTLGITPVESCLKGTLRNSDKYLECIIRHLGITSYHPAGTCKMGPKKDPNAVLDSELQVHGIEGLRVADASIMPQVTSGNTNIPSIMIGEKAADMIKMRWLKNSTS